jgi:hypothetical protein
MPLPDVNSPGGAWNANDQFRMETLDEELINAAATVRQALLKLVAVKQRFISQNLGARWPTLDTDYVHQKEDAQTRQEQVDLAALVDHLDNQLLKGVAGSQTPAALTATLGRYAR